MERMDDEKFLEEYLTMENWIYDNVPVPGEVFRDFVKNLYQQNLLVKNQMRVGARNGRSQADHLPGPESSWPARTRLSCRRRASPLPSSSARRTRRQSNCPPATSACAMGPPQPRIPWLPQAVAWLAERSS